MRALRARSAGGALVVCFAASAAAASGESFGEFRSAARGDGFEESFATVVAAAAVPDAELAPALAGLLERGVTAELAEKAEAAPAAGPPKTIWIGAVTAATLAGSAYNSFSDGPNQKFHFTNEGFLGQHTYAGGADKGSHFVSYYMVAKLLSGMYQELGMPVDQARLLGAGVSTFAGFVTELGDGRGRYGFSYEDLTMDALGAATYLGIAHFGLGDLIGFSAGLIPAPARVCCPYGGFGTDYSQLIYSADLRIAGLGARAHFDPGPARFLLFSLTYGSKGYPFDDPTVRERQVGVFVGVNFVEILHVARVPEKIWWGKILYFLFDVIRIPYTQIGYQYDLNHKRWSGPTIGDSFAGVGP